MKNRDVFLRDPVTEHIPNNGVATVTDAASDLELKTLRYELESFVCQGQYENGLRRILRSFLTCLSNGTSQKGIWVSGFYGSGKSHLVKVLRYLWTDYRFPDDGASARSLVKGMPDEVAELLKELETAGKRLGGLHAAAGNLGHLTVHDIPLGVLQVVLRSLKMPDQYPAACLYLRLHDEGSLGAVRTAVESGGRDFLDEMNKMYVSAPLREALVAHSPGFNVAPPEVPGLLKAQFPPTTERISVQQMVDTMHAALSLSGTLPLTLVVFDELQQLIGDSADRSYTVQEIVEVCNNRFQSRLLFVATGQSAITETPNLQRLAGRFQEQVSLTDSDVETVTRTIVLAKKPTAKDAVQQVLEDNSGEIFRHLRGSTIAPKAADIDILVADYPILPARRRFWERVLRNVDPSGTSSMLRAQLRIVDEAVRAVAEKDLGHVVPADALFDQMKDSLQQSGSLLLEERQIIEQQAKKDQENGVLKSRLCALIYLIGRLPKDGAGDIGVRATPEMLADLLVERLQDGGVELRRIVPDLLKEMADEGDLMLVDGEYRIQTREGAEWANDFETRKRRVSNDRAKLAEVRNTRIRAALEAELRTVTVLQGQTKEKRKLVLHLGQDPPRPEHGEVSVWVRDGWVATLKAVEEDAHKAGVEDPTVYVFVPALKDELNAAISGLLAAEDTLAAREVPNTEEGRQARASIEQRKTGFEETIKQCLAEALSEARVFQGGGSEVTNHDTLRGKLQLAGECSADRLFPKFSAADDPKWHHVILRARGGAGDCLEALGYKGTAGEHPVAKVVLEALGATAKRGAEIRSIFAREPYGWPQDAVDGSLLALLSEGYLHATRKGQQVKARDLDQKTIGDAEFRVEKFQLTTQQRIELRQLFQELNLTCKSMEEASVAPRFVEMALKLAEQAGGQPPCPEPPNASDLRMIQELRGNEQLHELHQRRDELPALLKQWRATADEIQARLKKWNWLQSLLSLATALEHVDTFREQADAIITGRQLLHNPDPVGPLLSSVESELRVALNNLTNKYEVQYEQHLAKLQASDAWTKLTEEQWRTIVRDAKLQKLEPPVADTTDELVAALQKKGLSEWQAECDALPARFAQGEVMATRLLEPTSVLHTVPRRLLRSQEDVEAFVAELRQELLAKVAHNPVQVS